jgi:transcriptional regulator with XRE-family HTH domain
MNLFSKNFLKILEEKGLDQKDVAPKIGISASTLSRTLHRNPRLSSILKAAKGLGVEVWELFVDQDKGELGPLTEDEKEFIGNLRRARAQEIRAPHRRIEKKTAK